MKHIIEDIKDRMKDNCGEIVEQILYGYQKNDYEISFLDNDYKYNAVFDIKDKEIDMRVDSDSLVISHRSDELISIEILSNDNEPTYSYYQIMRGDENTIFNVGYVEFEEANSKLKIKNAGTLNTIYDNRVVDTFYKKNWYYPTTKNLYQALNDIVDKVDEKKLIKPRHYIRCEYHPSETSKDVIFVSDDGIVKGLYVDLDDDAYLFKEKLSMMQEMMQNASYTDKVALLMDGCDNFKFDSVYDSVKDFNNTKLKKKSLT